MNEQRLGGIVVVCPRLLPRALSNITNPTLALKETPMMFLHGSKDDRITPRVAVDQFKGICRVLNDEVIEESHSYVTKRWVFILLEIR